MSKTYFIEWAATPTSYNPTQGVRIREEDLMTVVELEHGRLRFTNNAKIKYGIADHVVFKLYADTQTEREVYYTYKGHTNPYIGPHLLGMVGKSLPEVLK